MAVNGRQKTLSNLMHFSVTLVAPANFEFQFWLCKSIFIIYGISMSYISTAEEERDHFMSSMCSSSGPPHEINRGDLFNNVLHLFASDDITKEYPLRIRFKGELAIDTGGVMRDMVSAFWEIAYEKCCDGDSLLVPLIHPGSDTSMFTKLGRILSHGYMQCGFLPLKIAFLFLLLCCLELR